MVDADRGMLAAIKTCPEEACYREQGISIGSVHKLAVHCMAAQWLWLERWRGNTPRGIETHEHYPTRAALEARWPVVHEAVLAFAESKSQAELDALIHYRNMKGDPFSLPLGQLMIYLADHATYHRGQLNSMIKLAGGTPWGGSLHHYLAGVR